MRFFPNVCPRAVPSLSLWALAIAVGTAAPLKIDFSRSDQGGDQPLQSGWLGFSMPATGGDEVSFAFANDELAGAGGSVQVGVAGNSHTRDYAAATGIYAAQSDLLSDGPLLNLPGIITVSFSGLLDGEYELLTYHHTTQFGVSERPPATPFDVTLSDANGAGQSIATGLVVSDNSSAALTTQTTTFTVSGGNSVSVNFIRGANQGAGDHFALAALELSLSGPPPPPIVLGQVVISEFMASNEDAFEDGDGNSSDWIEIWNSTAAPVGLAGWYLTDDPADLTKWPFPAITLQPDEYLLVFASGQPTDTYVDAGGFLHTNFEISKAAGGYLALVDGTPAVVDEYLTYPKQEEDISYGLYGDMAPLSVAYLDPPTPGSKNGTQGFFGFVADTTFFPDRGFYSAPFDLVIESATPGATIRYTTDGSEPTETNGSDYPGGAGIPIGGTTIVRAAAFLSGYRPTNVDTQTYLFVDDIVDQPANPPGFPTTWTGSDYAMEDNAAHLALIAGDSGLTEAQAKAVVADALLELPAMSLTMHVDDWFSPSTGIYHNTQGRGMGWERGGSAELIHPPGAPGEGEGDLQIDCGIRMQGFTSRDPNRNPKHSLRLIFRGQYGDTKLRYKFFGDDGPDEFDTIVLRSNSQDAWVYNTTSNRAGQFIRDAWARKTHRAMGHPSPDSNWVHLFINGLYWGVYNPTERPDSAHSAAYFGGDKDDWDALKNHEEVLDGTGDAYAALLALIQNDPNNFNAGYRDLSDPADYAAAASLVDVDMLIDYMIHNMYAAATDWPGNNYVGYDRTGAHGGWKFYDWDNEHGMKHSVNTNRTLPHSRDDDSPTKFHHALRANAEYRQRFGDRLHRAMFNGGVLYVDPANPAWDPAHPERNVPAARWMELTGEIETALIAESARWGDYRKSTPYTVHDEFQSVRDDLLQNWFPTRSSVVLGQFRAQGLYPSFAAPEFGQFGGVVAPGFGLTMTAPDGGTIYYTLDGSDPQDSVMTYSAPVPLNATGEVRARVQQGGEWSALTAASFVVGTPASSATLVVAEIMYHPAGGTPHEYIELQNVSATETIELTGVKFTAGISFEFPVGTTLAPGGRILVVEDAVVFETQYGAGHPVAGQYTGKLDNGGEQMVLEDLNGAVIHDFAYGDDSPWPESPDGDGPSLVLVAPGSTPGYYSDPSNWRPSVAAGGTPGGTDSVPFTGTASADLDFDGIIALMEHALGSSDAISDPGVLPTIGVGTFPVSEGGPPDEFLTFTYRRNLGADDLIYTVEVSPDATVWSGDPADVVFVSSVDTGAGYALVTYRSAAPISAGLRQFMRLSVATR